jgi:hypothetical protein
MTDYFSDRELGPRARTVSEVSVDVWVGLVGLVENFVTGNFLAAAFPETCSDGNEIYDTNLKALGATLRAEIPQLAWPLPTTLTQGQFPHIGQQPWAPPTPIALDLLEFVHRHVAFPIAGDHHPYFKHFHLRFDAAAGKAKYRDDVNRVLARNGLAFDLGVDGRVTRLPSAVLGETLMRTVFQTGDRTLDVMLEESRRKFLDRYPLTRREALERLWDCFERVKSLRGADKRASITLILDSAAAGDPLLREQLEREAVALTEVGNARLIRHHEVRQVPVIDVDHVDYLFHRLFALVNLLLTRGLR